MKHPKRNRQGRGQTCLFPTSKKQFKAVFKALYGRYGPQGWWPGETPFEVIVGAILTQNTAWVNVEKAIANLKQVRLQGFRAMEEAPLRSVERAIRPSGFFRQKAQRLKIFVRHVRTRHGGSLKRFLAQPQERLRDELLSMHGIGPETADSIVLYAAGKPSFVVDAYTRRIFGRLGLLDGAASYETVRGIFQAALPPDTRTYNEYHALIVRHAKEACRTKPLCSGCVLHAGCANRAMR